MMAHQSYGMPLLPPLPEAPRWTDTQQIKDAPSLLVGQSHLTANFVLTGSEQEGMAKRPMWWVLTEAQAPAFFHSLGLLLLFWCFARPERRYLTACSRTDWKAQVPAIPYTTSYWSLKYSRGVVFNQHQRWLPSCQCPTSAGNNNDGGRKKGRKQGCQEETKADRYWGPRLQLSNLRSPRAETKRV
ncbi:hypothetical protein H112_01141 [Trichophyton rubrum D6]|uniref:Uncharacterized protein n=3 Tax=Trichophyton TaxID=5550 RepID=F2SY98_TRIRC|nr:uncharacterized protein TERG_07556 [Trichophyton rubrum CBS 118892]EZF10176.1 hypothetical protein H100_08530 [Trichophyton rubrum MR850]EZF45833.1 hypothetical protein H102_01131 [Trichophyton rubrum CBS 100081]EZF56520.1 hypothetical protein H103_01138 [Trichophyton rubrum CBS 288.86]EZF67104.1 hypothetical protein H104_01124 [Trichophyton rubrum CBS 289.86]EZF77866.1 hypothetical protein H105_01144 [Trichophyton soudanense CBS 452.61]EZF88451.1 hypothetical protein H110_01141 [Trichophy